MSIRTHVRRVADQEGGFSLIEMLTALVILVAVMGALVTLMVSATKSEVDQTQRVRAQQEARLALERIRHEIHGACKAEHMTLATGTVDTTSGAKTNVRLTPPVSSACPATTDPATAITWCMAGSGSRWVLRRVVGTPTSCDRRKAPRLTTSRRQRRSLCSTRPAASRS